MRWQDIDLKQKIWTIPGTVAKNGNAHAVPLSGMAVELLESVPKITPKGLVFTTTRVTPISGFSRAKKRLDNEILAAMREQAVKRKEEPEKVKALPEWRLHDLRRTAATGMASLRIPPHIVEAVLNHKSGTVSGVAAVYNRFDYADEKRAALEAWASKMQSLLSGGDGDKVLVMRERVAK
jgi:integrase